MINGDQVWLEELIGPSSNQPCSSPAGSKSSSEGNSSLCSWSSGVTCVINSSIKKQSQEAFQSRLREEKRRGRLAGWPSRGPRRGVHPGDEQGGDRNTLHAWPEGGGPDQGRGFAQTSTNSVKLQWLLEEKVEAKLKFSQFLDEVTSNVLDPNSLQAFGKPVSPSSPTTAQPEEKNQELRQRSPRLPRSMAQQQGSLSKLTTQEEQSPADLAQKTYLETDIDAVRKEDEVKQETPPPLDDETVIPPPPQFCQGFEMKSPFPEFHCDFPRYPSRSSSLPRGINMVSDESRPSL